MTEQIKITRGEIIEQLTQSTFDHAEMCPDYWSYVLSDGFKGFNNYTDEELIQEYRDYVSEDPDYDVTIELIEEVTQ
jgi:hypothetical protein